MAGYTPTRNFTPAQQESLRALTSGLPTKSAKIRALGAAGYTRAEIAAYLGISYQHVRSVLGPLESQDDAMEDAGEEPNDALPETGTLIVEQDGSIHVPPNLAALADVMPGQTARWRWDGDDLVFLGRGSRLRHAQELVARHTRNSAKTGTELLAEERRIDLAQEEERERTHG